MLNKFYPMQTCSLMWENNLSTWYCSGCDFLSKGKATCNNTSVEVLLHYVTCAMLLKFKSAKYRFYNQQFKFGNIFCATIVTYCKSSNTF